MIRLDNNLYFACDECPLMSQVSLQRRLSYAKEVGEFQFDHLSCDKIDCAFYVGGYCEDAFLYRNIKRKNQYRARGKTFRLDRKQREKAHAFQLATTSKGHFFPGYIDCDFINGKLFPIGTHVKFPNMRRKKFYKRYANRKVRRKGVSTGKSGYKKCYDLLWEIY